MNGGAWAVLKRFCGRVKMAGLCALIVFTVAMAIHDHFPASDEELARFEQLTGKSPLAQSAYRAWLADNPNPSKRELRAARKAILSAVRF